jgi:hypothetical protein
MVIQNAAFLLAPTQRITSGPPSRIPEGLSPFKAYEITSAGEKNRNVVKLSGAFGPDERVLDRAAYLCVPVELWHHHDHFPIKHQEHCMLVFEMQGRPCDVNLTTLDLFGMNRLKAKSSKWICVPAEVVENPSDESR